jgi:hypothetical protein
MTALPLVHCFGQSPVVDAHDAIDIENPRVVRHDDDRTAVVRGKRPQQFHDSAPGLGVERRRRLIGQDDARLAHERARDGHALLLAAGQIARQQCALSPRPTASSA